MTKKLFAFMLGLWFAFGASATINFPASSVQYWVGTGSNSAVVIIGWDDNPNGNFALAWGVRWNGSAMAVNMLDTIATYDSRVAYAISSGFVTQIGYNDGTLVSGSSASYWCYTINGGYAGAYGTQPMTNGDVMEISSSCYFSLSSAVAATDPNPAPDPDPVDATIAFSDILYWVGSGSDSAALIVNYGQPDTAFAWGFLFNGSTTAQAMLDSIAAADPRFWYVGSPSMGGDIHFILNTGDTLGLSPVGALGYNFWWANLNGRSAGAGIGATLHNGDVFKYGDLNSAIGWDTLGGYCMEEAWIKAPTPVSVPDTTPILDTVVVDATVDFADIACWAGSGPDSTALIVSFANPDTAFAWGVLINGTTTSADMLEAVMAVDTNLSITDHPDWGDGQIRYRLADGTVISRTATQWLFNINGVDAWGDDDVVAGDVFKFGDQASGIQVSTFQYVWTAEPTIVNFCDVDPQPEHGPFCGAAGTEGSDAIAADSSAIVAWATACTLELGPQDISVAGSPTVSYPTTGDAAEQAVGPCSMTDNLSVVSLGDGGSATLTFEKPIRNGEGPDFAVFENSFSDTFLELAFVEVSSDGERFVRFPATSLTQTETQATTIDPTFINNLAGKYRSGYGTPFDLEELRDSTGINIDSIVYVRVVDVVGSIDPRYATYDAFGHIVNDPWPTNTYSGGFDLDGVAVIHQAEGAQGIADAEVLVSGLWPNPATETLNVSLQRAAEAELYDLTGRRVASYSLAAGRNILDLTSLPTGVYMLRVEGSANKIVKQ